MRSPARLLLQLIIVISFILASMQATAGSQPPDPGGTPVGGGPPVGGGAPVGSGTVILIVAATAYGLYKTKVLLRNKLTKASEKL